MSSHQQHEQTISIILKKATRVIVFEFGRPPSQIVPPHVEQKMITKTYWRCSSAAYTRGCCFIDKISSYFIWIKFKCTMRRIFCALWIIAFWHFQTSVTFDPSIKVGNVCVYLTFNGSWIIINTMAYQSNQIAAAFPQYRTTWGIVTISPFT